MTVFELVAREQRRVGRLVRADTVMRVVIIVLGVLTGGALALAGARWIALPRIVPFAVWGMAAALAAVVVRNGARRVRRVAAPESIADAVELEQRMRHGSVRGIVELAGDRGAFVTRAALRLGTHLAASGVAVAPALERRLRRGVLTGVGVLAPVGFLAAFSGAERPDGWRALLHPVAAWQGSLLTRVAIDGAPGRALRGSMLGLTLKAPGRRSVSLRRRTTGSAWIDMELPVADGRARTMLGPLDADLTLVASDGRGASDTAVVRVVDRPFVGDVAMRATYPAYLHRNGESLPVDALIRVPRGTTIDIEGHASEPLAAVALVQGAESVRLAPNERRFSGRFTPTTSGSWSWTARGVSAAIADVPPPLTVEVLTDSAPQAQILQPASDSLVLPESRVEFQMAASDDHGLQSVTLRAWRVSRDGRVAPVTAQKLAGGGMADWAGLATLDMGNFELGPGDAVHVQLVARDETPWGQEGASRELVLRVPATDEQRQAARASADSAAARALAAVRAQASLQQRTADAANANRGKAGETNGKAEAGMRYDRAQQAKTLASEQRQMADRVKQLEQASRALENQLRASGSLDTALAAQLREAQKLLREALTPEMLQALRQLDQSAQQLSSEQTRQSMQQLLDQQKKLRETLEKSAEILRRAAVEGALQTLRDEAKELAKAQRARAENAVRQSPDDAKRLADRTSQLARDIERLRNRLQQEKADTAARMAASAQAAVEQSQAAMKGEAQKPEGGQSGKDAKPGQGGKQGEPRQPGQPAQQAQPGQQAQQGQQGQQGQAGQQGQSGQQGQPGAKQAADAMERAAEALAEGRKAQVDQWKQELTGELDRAVQEMLQLARQQDELSAKASHNAADPGLRGEQSALQQGVQKASERLQAESRRSALVSQGSQRAMSQAEQKVAQASRDAGDPRAAGQAASSMNDAATALRQTAASLARDRERAAASKSASGLPELLAQLQQLARQQGSLNGQMQSLLQQRGGESRAQSLSPEGREQARALARTQRDVARRLDEAADADASGKAAELAKEARQLAGALEQGAADPTVLDRQQRLFKRMLDAGHALENDQKDESARRESRPGDQNNPFLPSGTSAAGKAALKFPLPEWNDLRGLNPEERRLVIEYFRRLNAEKP